MKSAFKSIFGEIKSDLNPEAANFAPPKPKTPPPAEPSATDPLDQYDKSHILRMLLQLAEEMAELRCKDEQVIRSLSDKCMAIDASLHHTQVTIGHPVSRGGPSMYKTLLTLQRSSKRMEERLDDIEQTLREMNGRLRCTKTPPFQTLAEAFHSPLPFTTASPRWGPPTADKSPVLSKKWPKKPLQPEPMADAILEGTGIPAMPLLHMSRSLEASLTKATTIEQIEPLI